MMPFPAGASILKIVRLPLRPPRSHIILSRAQARELNLSIGKNVKPLCACHALETGLAPRVVQRSAA